MYNSGLSPCLLFATSECSSGEFLLTSFVSAEGGTCFLLFYISGNFLNQILDIIIDILYRNSGFLYVPPKSGFCPREHLVS